MPPLFVVSVIAAGESVCYNMITLYVIPACTGMTISVGRVKKRSDVPVRVGTLLLTGTLRFTRPADCQPI